MANLAEFERYMNHLCEVLGHADRRAGFIDYSRGLMLPIERKSVEPLAAHTDPWNVGAKHQSLHHVVAQSDWSDAAVLGAVREYVRPALKLTQGSYWIIDDTGFPKKGKHSVGIARQYCGQMGKQDNCQVAVSLSLASAQGSVPIAWRLYLPQEWASILSVARRRAYRQRSTSGPNHTLRSSRFARRKPRASPLVSCWPMRGTATTRTFARASGRWD